MKTKYIITSFIAIMTLFATANLHAGSCSTSHASKVKDIVDTAANAGAFNTLVAAVTAADLADTLKGTGPFTVFAPTDEAFAKLPNGTLENLLKPENKDQLIAILTYHVVPGKVMAADVKNMEAPTVNGTTATLAVSNEGVTIEGANVTQTDIKSSNGVIHVIDQVILPAA